MALVIPFLDSQRRIREAFLGYFPCSQGLSGEAISNQIHDSVQYLGLDMNNSCGQSYDVAGNMAGKCSSTAVLSCSNPKSCSVTTKTSKKGGPSS